LPQLSLQRSKGILNVIREGRTSLCYMSMYLNKFAMRWLTADSSPYKSLKIPFPSRFTITITKVMFSLCTSWRLMRVVLYIHSILISNFYRVLNVICFILVNSPVTEFYMPTFRNTLFHFHRRVGMKNSETLAYKIQTSGNYPEESIQYLLFLKLGTTWEGVMTSTFWTCFLRANSFL
jgi:hypothetical protein